MVDRWNDPRRRRRRTSVAIRRSRSAAPGTGARRSARASSSAWPPWLTRSRSIGRCRRSSRPSARAIRCSTTRGASKALAAAQRALRSALLPRRYPCISRARLGPGRPPLLARRARVPRPPHALSTAGAAMTLPKRQLGVLIAAALVIANMIGSGVFTGRRIPGQRRSTIRPTMLADLGGRRPARAVSAPLAYAELGAMMPQAGGEYGSTCARRISPGVGFMSGWVSLTAGFSAPIAAIGAAVLRCTSALLIPGTSGRSPSRRRSRSCSFIADVRCLHAFDTRVRRPACRPALIDREGRADRAADRRGACVLAPATGRTSRPAATASRCSATRLRRLPRSRPSSCTVSFAYSGLERTAYIAGEIERPAAHVAARAAARHRRL